MNLPVYGSLPKSIIHAVEDVQEHRSDVVMGGPVSWNESLELGVFTSIGLFISVSSSPDNDRDGQQENPTDYSTMTTGQLSIVENKSEADGSDDLRHIIEKGVEGLGTSSEVRTVDSILLIRVEPVGRKEHGEEHDHKGLVSDSLPHTPDLASNRWILHEDNS